MIIININICKCFSLFDNITLTIFHLCCTYSKVVIGDADKQRNTDGQRNPGAATPRKDRNMQDIQHPLLDDLLHMNVVLEYICDIPPVLVAPEAPLVLLVIYVNSPMTQVQFHVLMDFLRLPEESAVRGLPNAFAALVKNDT